MDLKAQIDERAKKREQQTTMRREMKDARDAGKRSSHTQKLDGRDRLAEAMSEDDLLTSVLELCKVLGLRTAHFRPARTEKGWRTAVAGDGKGFPDLIIVGSQLIARELKSEHGRTTPEQVAWQRDLFGAQVDATDWRPSDWRSGRIQRELQALVR